MKVEGKLFGKRKGTNRRRKGVQEKVIGEVGKNEFRIRLTWFNVYLHNLLLL
jgi:hypothetical protein